MDLNLILADNLNFGIRDTFGFVHPDLLPCFIFPVFFCFLLYIFTFSLKPYSDNPLPFFVSGQFIFCSWDWITFPLKSQFGLLDYTGINDI